MSNPRSELLLKYISNRGSIPLVDEKAEIINKGDEVKVQIYNTMNVHLEKIVVGALFVLLIYYITK